MFCKFLFWFLSGVTSICNLQKMEGNCQARYTRWFFDANEQKCKWFHYSGCNGNENNFRERHKCEKACPGNSVQSSLDNSLNSRPKPVVIPSRSDIKVSQPIFLQQDSAARPQPESRSLTSSLVKIRSNRSHRDESERRRKRRLKRRRDRKRLRRLRRKRRRLLKANGKKKRREGKTARNGRKNKNKKHRKNRKNRRKKKKDRNTVEDVDVTTSSSKNTINSNESKKSNRQQSIRTLTVLEEGETPDDR